MYAPRSADPRDFAAAERALRRSIRLARDAAADRVFS